MSSSLTQQVGKVYFALCKSVDTPISLGMYLRYKYGEYEQLATTALDPLWYNDPVHFQNDYLCVEYLSKYKGLDTRRNLREVALQAFVKSEEQCRETNRRFRTHSLPQGALSAILHLAQRKIVNVLGPLDVFEVLKGCRWGPGSTSTLKGADARLDNKIAERRISVTNQALPYLRAVVGIDIHWLRARGLDADGPCSLLDSDFKIVAGSRTLTVPKNAKTDRTICAEPTGNIFLQLGVGRYIRHCLNRVGVNLDDQSINQEMASRALTYGLATVDLKAASDTISRELVYDLLPLEWAMFLNALRCPETNIDGARVHLEKFSSMGNGFTFELESLIFWALTSSTVQHLGMSYSKERLSVYGDDIICPSEALPLLTHVLEACGFTINTEKTHANSQFRESCGKHYFGGVDVTPVYQKELPETLDSRYRFCNRIVNHALARGHAVLLDRTLYTAWLSSRAVFGSDFEHFVPLGEPDGGLAVPMEELLHHVTVSRVGLGYRVRTLAFTPKKLKGCECALLAYTLRAWPETPFGGRIGVRRLGKWRTRVRHFHCLRDAVWV